MDNNPRARYEPSPEIFEPNAINVSIYYFISLFCYNNSISALKIRIIFVQKK